MKISQFIQQLEKRIFEKGYKSCMKSDTKTQSFFVTERLYKKDGEKDLYFSVFFNKNKLYINKQDKTEYIQKFGLTF